MIQNKIVIRYLDGKIVKGQTIDFLPTKSTFHVSLIDSPPNTPPLEVNFNGVKAIFFVKDYTGNSKREEILGFPEDKPAPGRKLKVTFVDGETLVGTTQGYDPNRPGFFIIPADPDSNNDRCFIVASSTQKVSFI